MKFNKAVKIVTTEINKDSSRQLCYIQNIAYSFQTEYGRYCEDNKKAQLLTRKDIHTISTRAAKHFLDMWLLNADKEGAK